MCEMGVITSTIYRMLDMLPTYLSSMTFFFFTTKAVRYYHLNFSDKETKVQRL